MAIEVEVRDSLPMDVDMLFENIAPPDWREIALMTLGHPRELFRKTLSVGHGPQWTGFIDGELACMFGVTGRTVFSSIGQPWLVGTRKLRKHPVTFMRYTRSYFEIMKSMFSVLRNWVHVENRAAVRWLKWLGFRFREPVAIRPRGAMFCPFEWRADSCV